MYSMEKRKIPLCISRKVYNPTARDGICTADGGQLGAVHHGEDVQLLLALDLPHA